LKISKTKHLAFTGLALRLPKLLAGRQVLRLNNPQDLKNHSSESSGTPSHSVCVGIATRRKFSETEGQTGQSESWHKKTAKKAQ
jgi:hypothetical protein